MGDEGAPGYPTHWEADVVLRDGGTAHVRPITPADADALQAFHVGQSERSTYFRFFAPLRRLPERDLQRFTHVDHRDRVALIVVEAASEPPPVTGPLTAVTAPVREPAPAGERIIAVARYDRTAPGTADVAFNVADDHHGRGLGSVLLEHLAAAARERGIHRFTADVLPHNARMIGVFREAGFVVHQELDDGILSLSIDIDPTERSLAVMADREHRAEARSVQEVLTPRSVLVVLDKAKTAPPDGPTLARTVALHLLGAGEGNRAVPVADGGEPGDVVLRPEVHVVGLADPPPGTVAWPDLAAVPGPVDLVVLVGPAGRAAKVVGRCRRLRPHAVVVLSGGFAETGPAGLARQRELLRVAHSSGTRILGPRTFGFFRHGVAGEPTVNASLAGVVPKPGRVGLFCQSAPLAVGLLASARRRGLGLSTFVSSGNRADLSGNDLMQFWGADEVTEVVGLYLESIGNPRKFARVARRLAMSKPVVVLAAGRSGHVVPAGHVLRRTQVPRSALAQLLRQSGVIRVENQHQLMDVTQLLALQPLPAGRRVSVLADSEALAALVAEAAGSAGLTVVDQRVILPEGGRTDADLLLLEAELAEVCADPASDAVVLVHIPAVGGVDDRVPAAVARAAAASGRTTVACIVGLSGLTPQLTAPDPSGFPRTVPAYAAPEDGVVALAAAARYAAWRGTDHGHRLAPPGIDRARARRLVEEHLDGAGDDAADGGVSLDRPQVAELLGCYGIHPWPRLPVRDGAEAVRAAETVGWPVALMSTVEHLRHRLDLGGVRLDLPGPTALLEALAQMQALHGPADAPSFEVQHMADPGTACVIRTSEDPRFGPVVSFGIAGDAIDLLGDVSYGVAPLTDVDVAQMVRSVRAGPRLFGYRGLPPLDVAALEDVLGRASVMADDLPELRSLVLHPVLVAEHGAAVLDARVELARAGRVDSDRRGLPQQ